MPYCTANDVRNFTGITETEATNSSLGILIDYATAEVNECISVLVVREYIGFIDNTRENDIDGTNTTYYARNWKGHHLCDMGNDGDVSTDDIEVFQKESDGTETQLTVSTITPSECKFTLSSAPQSNVELYVTYTYTNVPVDPPHSLVKMATAYLAASMAYTKLDATKANRFSFGKVSVTRGHEAYDTYYNKYRECINKINREMFSISSVDYGI
jgi:hypothetical protein